MGDRVLVQFPVPDVYLATCSATQVNSAWLFFRGKVQWVPVKGRLRLVAEDYRLVRFVCGWQAKLGDRLVTHGPYMSALEIKYWLYEYICLFFTFLCDCQGQYNFNKLYLVYVSCSCSCIHFFTCKSADSVSLCMFLVICSTGNLITRKCCRLNTALILLTLIFLNR